MWWLSKRKNEDTAQQNNLIIAIKETQALYKLLKAKSAFSIIKEKYINFIWHLVCADMIKLKKADKYI
jgi:hypothetical protein